MLLAALLLALAPAQAAQGDDPATKAAAGSPFIFAQACLLRATVKQTSQAYSAGADALGGGVLTNSPELKGVLTIDGADGQGCRVRYFGPLADTAWAGYRAAFDKLTSAPAPSCTASAAGSPDKLTATCTMKGEAGDPQSATHTADLSFQRSGSGAQGVVTAMLTHLRP